MLKLLLATTVALACATSALAKDLNEMTWDEIVAQAQEEGEMTWYVWYLRDDFRRAVKPFEEEYGIKVTIPEANWGASRDKVIAEAGRDVGDIDVYANTYRWYGPIDVPNTFMPMTMLPEDDGRTWTFAGESHDKYVVAYWGNQTAIAYDPAKISAEDLPHTPQEFAAFWEVNPRKIGFNYQNGGSGPSFVLHMLRNLPDADFYAGEADATLVKSLDKGFELFNANPDSYVVTASNADSITRISDSELWMAPAFEDHLAGLQKRGEVRDDIRVYIPEMGMHGGANGVSIPTNAPHPAAAAVFVNWLTSPETQTQLNIDFGIVPMNSGADDSNALIPSEQRAFSVPTIPSSTRGPVMDAFVENVILER